MSTPLPSLATIRDRLSTLSYAGVKQLALDSKVPFTTLWKIRVGTTVNPGIETVRMFIGHLPDRPKKKTTAKQAA